MKDLLITERKRVFGVPVDVITVEDILEKIDFIIKNEIKHNNIMSVNAEKIMAAQKNGFLLKCLENAQFLIPDGTGATVALRVIHNIKVERIPGADLMHHICGESVKKGYKIFIYGATEDVNKESVEQLKRLYPGINIVGRCNGYVSQKEIPELIEQINNSGAQILFVALGSPKQELWISENLKKLNVNICQGIGGTLDTIAGAVRRAPYIFQKLGAEWIYRLIRQPRRIRRHINIWIFIFKVIKVWLIKKLNPPSLTK